MSDYFANNRLAKVGLWVALLPNIFCSAEMVPGWGFNLGLSHTLLYVIALTGGAIGGGLMGGRYFLAGIAGGLLGSLGALWAVVAYLAAVDTSYSAIMAIVALAGALPGIGLGIGLGYLQKRLTERPPTPQ